MSLFELDSVDAIACLPTIRLRCRGLLLGLIGRRAIVDGRGLPRGA